MVRDFSKDVLVGLMWAIIIVRLFFFRVFCSEVGIVGGDGNRDFYLFSGMVFFLRILIVFCFEASRVD